MDLRYIKDNWKNDMNSDIDASISAWDSVAENYVYDKKINFTDDYFLKCLLAKIPVSNDMSVLDIGCGAGAYSAALAQKAGRVVGIDFSPEMLKAGRIYAEKQGIINVEFLRRNWWCCDGEEFKGRFDLVFAHTTPAVSDYASLIKMMEASRRYCALCKPAKRTDEVFDAIREIAGLKVRCSDDQIAYAFDTIWAMGGEPEISYNKTVWESTMPLNEAKVWYINRMRGSYAIDEQTEHKICHYLEQISKDGMIRENIKTTLVTMIWEAAK